MSRYFHIDDSAGEANVEWLPGLKLLGLKHAVNDDRSIRAQCPDCSDRARLEFAPMCLTIDIGSMACARGCDPVAIRTWLQDAMERSLAIGVVTLEEFAGVDEAGAEPIVGESGSTLIPEGGDVMFFGSGGAGKTSLSIDLAFHLAVGGSWLGMPVPKAVRVLLIESEGPRPFFRAKLKRKLGAWPGSPLEGRVSSLSGRGASSPSRMRDGAQARGDDQPWRDRRVDSRASHPAWDGHGGHAAGGSRVHGARCGPAGPVGACADRRAGSSREQGRRGSGAWEGAGDTLLHVQGAGNGHTVVHVQKARWDSERHGKTLHLAWAEGESFTVEGDRDYVAELVDLLSDGRWRTIREMMSGSDGIGAGEKAIKAALEEQPERFESRTGAAAIAVGRHRSATVWQVHSTQNAADASSAFLGGAEIGASGASPLKGCTRPERTPVAEPAGASHTGMHPTHLQEQDPNDDWVQRVAERNGDLG